MLLNLNKTGILDFFAVLAYVKGALRKNQLLTYFVEQFKGKSWKD